jgi:hypothetical protein
VSLATDQPIIVVQAAYSKHREEDSQPLPGWLAEKLSRWLRKRRDAAVDRLSVQHFLDEQLERALAEEERHSKADRLWPGSWADKGAEMLRIDLAAARKKWLTEAESDPGETARREQSDSLAYRDQDRYFDFHSLRVQFGTSLAEAGVHPKKAHQLLRHKSIELTMGVYTALEIADVAEALDGLPDPRAGQSKQKQVATGTDGRGYVVSQIDSRSGTKRHSLAVIRRDEDSQPVGRDRDKSLRSQRVMKTHEAEGMGLSLALRRNCLG